MKPLVGARSDRSSWRGPFFGVSALMTGALVTAFRKPRPSRPQQATTLADPFRAPRHRGLLRVSGDRAAVQPGFFHLLAFTPFLGWNMEHGIGLIFGWGVCLAFTSVVVARDRNAGSGPLPTLIVNLLCMTATLAVMAVGTDHRAVLASAVVVGRPVLRRQQHP